MTGLLLRGGHVCDPATGRDGPADVLIEVTTGITAGRPSAVLTCRSTRAWKREPLLAGRRVGDDRRAPLAGTRRAVREPLVADQVVPALGLDHGWVVGGEAGRPEPASSEIAVMGADGVVGVIIWRDLAAEPYRRAELVERHRAEAMLPRHSAERLSVERS